MTLLKARSFQRDRRAHFRWQQAGRSLGQALLWDDAVEAAVDEIAAAPAGYALARESDDLPGGPYPREDVRRRAPADAPDRIPRHPLGNRTGRPAASGEGDLTALDL